MKGKTTNVLINIRIKPIDKQKWLSICCYLPTQATVLCKGFVCVVQNIVDLLEREFGEQFNEVVKLFLPLLGVQVKAKLHKILRKV